jgi:hypothetical protein
MRMTAVVAALLAMLAGAACGSSTESDGNDAADGPTVEITSVQLAASNATLAYTVDDDGAPVTVTIDWGDGSPLDGYSGSGGELSALHEYAPGVTSLEISVTATDDDGNSAEDRRAIELAGAPDETSTTRPSSSTTSISTSTSTTTSTTTTTTAATTTTATTPPTTPPSTEPPITEPPPTTTTTNPPPERINLLGSVDGTGDDVAGRLSSADHDVETGEGGARIWTKCKLRGLGEETEAVAELTWSLGDVRDVVRGHETDYILEVDGSVSVAYDIDITVDRVEHLESVWDITRTGEISPGSDDDVSEPIDIVQALASVDGDEISVISGGDLAAAECALKNGNNPLSFGGGDIETTIEITRFELVHVSAP